MEDDIGTNLQGVIEVRVTRDGKYYVRMVYENGHILWHGSGHRTLAEAVDDANAAINAALVHQSHGRHTYLVMWRNRKGEPYFKINRETGKGVYGWSESYSSTSKCTQGKAAAVRIFEQYRETGAAIVLPEQGR